MKKERAGINAGRLSFRLVRVLGHLGKISQLMVVWLFLDSLKNRYGISFWWLLLIFPAIFVIHWLDKHYIYPGESKAASESNPAWQELIRKVGR